MSRWALVLCVLAGCSSAPPPCPKRVVVDFDGADLAVPGPQRLNFTWWTEGVPGTTELSLSLLDPDGGVVLASSSRIITTARGQDSWEFEVADPALLRAEATARCAGNEIGSNSRSWFVFEPLSLDRRLPRRCDRLQRLGQELFDCDGVVVDVDGGPVPGWLPAFRSWAVAPARWTYFPQVGELDWEAGDGGSFSITVGELRGWVAAETFAVLDNSTLVAFEDGGLVQRRFDAGIDSVRQAIACAATVRDGRQYVGLCEEPYLTNWQVPERPAFWRCEIVGEALARCVEHTGYRVRHDPRSGRVLLLESNELRWMDFVTGEQSQRHVLPRELTFAEGPPNLGFGGYRSTFITTRWESEEVTGQIVGEMNPRVLVYRGDGGVRWSWDLAWSPGENETRWTSMQELGP